MLTELAMNIFQVLLPLIGLAVIAGLSWLISYLQKKGDAIGNEVARQSYLAALVELYEAAKTAVLSTQQCIVDDLKEAAEDGKLTDKEKQEVMLHAKEVFLREISENALNILEAAKGPIHEWLEDYLESLVYENKSDTLIALEGLSDPLSSVDGA